MNLRGFKLLRTIRRFSSYFFQKKRPAGTRNNLPNQPSDIETPLAGKKSMRARDFFGAREERTRTTQGRNAAMPRTLTIICSPLEAFPMHDKSMRRSAVMVAGALGLAGAFFAGVAFAADPAFDQANDSITKAIAQLQSAQNPNDAPGGKPPFGGHREKAINLLKDAQAQIAKAKAFQDAPPAAPKPPPKHKD